MNYRVNRGGQDLGFFTLEDMKRMRDAGTFTGNELVWCEGMEQWQPLNNILPGQPPKFIAPPPPSPPPKRVLNRAVVAVLVIAGALFVGGLVTFGVFGYRVFQTVPVRQLSQITEPKTRSTAYMAASRPVSWTTNTQTWADVQKGARAFRYRQYVEGYRLRGDRNPEYDLAALQLLTNWIAANFGGIEDTNVPSIAKLSDRLANDPACQDPLILTIAAVNTAELHEANRRLERAVKGFENSKHRGYPKFFATEMLAGKLIHDQTDRLPVLDAEALQDLKNAFSDGSIQPGDQAELAEVLINDWGSGFFARNAAPVYSMIQQQGDSYKWLALVLEGESEISEAWRARGGGYSDSVSDTGWKGFTDHLTKARDCLTRAWNLRPNLPLAPCRMIYVSLGDSDISEMRDWFDRTTAAQLDYARAWSDMRWGLRPRWYGDYNSMLAFGVTALKTHRFDTDVPRKFFDSLSDVESEMSLKPGEHLYARQDIWPHLREMYEGYIAEPSISADARDGWRSTYSVIAALACKYDVARKELEALHWQPHPGSLIGWNRDLSLMPEEIAARTGQHAAEVTDAELDRDSGNTAAALKIYQHLAASPETDELGQKFVQDRLASLHAEQHFQAGEWVDFLPKDTNFTGWHIEFGKFKLLPDGALEVQSDQWGHLAYSRMRPGMNFEVRGQFEVVTSTTTAFQAGLAMGLPQYDTYNWYAFRMKRNSDEGDVASFSQHWTKRQVLAPVALDSHTNTFDVIFQQGQITATVDGHQVFDDVAPPRNAYVSTNEFLLGLGAFNDSDSTVIRYRNLQVRRL